MTYATQADLEARYNADELIQLTDAAGLGEIDGTAIASALARADAEINGRLSARYSVPLTDIPPLVVEHACAIARYRLYRDAPPEHVRADFQDAIKYLDAVAAGKASLGVDADGDAPSSQTATIDVSQPGDGRVFSLADTSPLWNY